MARIGHRTSCDAVIQQGCQTVHGDSTTASYGVADADLSVAQQLLLSAIEVIGVRSAVREGGLLDGALRKLFGEPVDVATGDYADFRVDFEYPSVLPLRLERTYPGRMHVDGLLGARWICNWSQRLLFSENGSSVLLEDGDGQRLRFALPPGERLCASHLKAPYYRLDGTRAEAQLYDSRTGWTLVFEPAGRDGSRLSAIRDDAANHIEFFYTQDRLSRIVHSDGVAFQVETTAQGLITRLTMEGEDGELVRYGYDAQGRLADAVSLFKGEFHYGYTAEGWLSQWRDRGATRVELRYDVEGRVVATRTPDGLFNDRFAYFPEERRSQYIAAEGGVRSFWSNADGLVVREEDPIGAVTLRTWDSLERLQSITDAAGRTTRFNYDEDGRLVAAADWAGRASRWRYDRQGRLLERAHGDGRIERFEYDARGVVIAWTAPSGRTERYSYDDRGRLTGLTQAGGSEISWDLDGLGRPRARIDALGRRTACAYDRFGRLLSVTDAGGRTTRYAYVASPSNPRNDLTHVLRPDGGRTLYGYNAEGLLDLVEQAEGQSTRYGYGAFDLLRRAVDAAGGVTLYDYDRAGRLTAVTNPAGAQWRYAYDAAGRLSAETDWAGRHTAYHRDALGRLEVKVTPDNLEQRFRWDERDRLTSVVTADAAVTYEYDEADRLVRAATWRHAPDAPAPEEPETDIRLNYDSHGRVTEEVQNGVAVAYRYDAAGCCVGRSSPSGEAALTFDAAGRLSALETNGHGLRFGRDVAGLETRRETVASDGAPTAFTLLQAYDACARLTGQRVAREAANAAGWGASPAGAATTFELCRRYGWDRAGRLSEVEDADGGAVRYGYDLRDQVGRVDRPAAAGSQALAPERYRYDALLNLSEGPEGDHGYWRDCVVRAGRDSFRYDARGRMVERLKVRDGFRPRRFTYSWDGFDRLVGVETDEGASWRYTYDAFGRRVRKERLGGAHSRRIDYVWHGALMMEAWRRGDPGQAARIERWHYEPGGFRPLAKEVVEAGAVESGRFYPVVTDAAGTPKAMFSERGACVWRAEHALWGRVQASRDLAAVRDDVEGDDELDCLLRFQNQWADVESDLHYNLRRHYDPDTGQYVSPDPIGLGGGTRTHAYVHDPLQWFDPLGLAGCASKVLGRNMENSGTTRPAETAAHHIVAHDDPRAAPARAILARDNVNINSADNGVFLPRNTSSPNPSGAAVHSTLHTDDYYDAVNNQLVTTPPGGSATTLQGIRSGLQTNSFPH